MLTLSYRRPERTVQWKHWEKERFREVRNIVSVPKHSLDIVFNGHHILSVVYLTGKLWYAKQVPEEI